MRSTTKSLLPLAAIAAASFLLLTGCAQTPPASQEQPFTPAATEAEASSEAVTVDRNVEIVEVVEADLFVVTPTEADDPLYGEDITVHIYGIRAPSGDECGAAEARAWAPESVELRHPELKMTYPTAELLRTPGEEPELIDADGVHQAFVGSWTLSSGYSIAALGEGFAVLDPSVTAAPGQPGKAKDAAENGKGLYATCPGFGS